MTETSATLDCKCKDGIIRNSCGTAVIETPSGLDVSDTLDASYYKGCGTRNGNERTVVCYENHAKDSRVKELYGVFPQINAKAGMGGGNLPLVQECFTKTAHPQNPEQGQGFTETETAKTLSVHTSPASEIRAEELVCSHSLVRRLTPVECERLMGFPDNHTRIAYNGKPEEECPDSPRYKACGNSMCVNVMEWIGRQIEQVDRYDL